MKVSVVIPVYNTERYVAEAIESVLVQTRPPDEIIVVDDGSTDRTPAILTRFAPRVVLLRQEHSGPSAALNTGIAHARGDLLAFNDADDVWLPEKLQLQYALLAQEPGTDAVFGMVRQFVSPDWQMRENDPADRHEEQRGIYRAAMLIRRNAFDRVGLFDTSLQLVDFIDWYGRAILQGLRSQVLPEVLVRRRIHATNTGRTHRDAQRSEDLLALKRLLDMRRRGGVAPVAGVQRPPRDDQANR